MLASLTLLSSGPNLNIHPRMRKLMYRVVFPMDLKLSNTTADAEGVDSPYALHAGRASTEPLPTPLVTL